jgi:hypothetical protein
MRRFAWMALGGSLLLTMSGCDSAPHPLVIISVLGPRVGATALTTTFGLNGDSQTHPIETETKEFVVDYPRGARGQFVVVVDAFDASDCVLWSANGTTNLQADDGVELSTFFAQITPPRCH